MSTTVTLKGIKRRGLVNWRERERWIHFKVNIWSGEHGAWWRAGCSGYTDDRWQAGVYDFPNAYEVTKHCGPEKDIIYFKVK